MLVKMETQAAGGGGQVLAVDTGNISDSSGRVECGFEPKHILIASQKYNDNVSHIVYCEGGKSATTYTQWYNGTRHANVSIASGAQITSIDETGFNIGYPSYWNNGQATMLVSSD